MKYVLKPSQIIKLPKLFRKHHLTFIDKVHESENIFTYRFAKPETFEYRAGQHFIFKLPHEAADKGGDMRLFSLSSSPHENYIAFTARYLDDKGSSFKRALHSLSKGDVIFARGPSPINDFFDIDPKNGYIFIIGGIGITPLRSVLVDAVQANKEIAASIIWANKSDSLPFTQDFEIIKAQLKNVSMKYITNPKHIEVEDLKKMKSNYIQPKYVISGTPGFSKAMEKMLVSDLGVSSAEVKSYAYEAGFGMGGGYKG
jgi:ferredoxin-NADP reductase